MMNNKIRICIVPLIICAVLLTQTSGFAQNAESEATVEFIPGTGPTVPVHPEDPETPGNGGGVEGSLAIVSVSHFDFGIIPVTSETASFDIKTSMPNIQVVDLRGTAAGWNVTAAVSRFESGTVNTLPGAAIHITGGRPNSLSSSAAPMQIPDTILTTDSSPVPVIKAGAGAGTGQWIMRWYPSGDTETGDIWEYIKLEIPAGSATTGSHTATINWILGNTP